MDFFVGTDIENVSRFKDRNKSFKDLIFTPDEQEYCDSKPISAQHYAARFCAKEAVVKAFGSIGVDINDFRLVEVVSKENGAPVIRLHSVDLNLEIDRISLSMSHCKEYATATAVLFKG